MGTKGGGTQLGMQTITASNLVKEKCREGGLIRGIPRMPGHLQGKGYGEEGEALHSHHPPNPLGREDPEKREL